jgi:AcrR family transcriptional regulator
MTRKQRQESILRGAAEAFARTGYAQTSMEQVAAASGITKLIVYRHFASKDALYRAVLDRTFVLLADAQAQTRLRGGRNPGLRAVLSVARSWPSGLRLLLRHAPREPDFAEYAAEIRKQIVKSVEYRSQLGGDLMMRRWMAEFRVSCVFEAVLAWLDCGHPDRDEDFLRSCGAATFGMAEAWRSAEGAAESDAADPDEVASDGDPEVEDAPGGSEPPSAS